MAFDYSTIQSLGLGDPGQQAPANKTQLGQSDFFKLMTTQLSNQNPLKPLEGTEFLQQIAQFNTVTGINDLQKSFDKFSASMTSSQSLQASNLVGHDVYVKSGEAVLEEDGTIDGQIVLPNNATDVELSILSPSGETVRTFNLGSRLAGEVPFSWNGTDADGEALPPGDYQIRAQAVIGSKNQSVDTLVRDRIDSVTLAGPKGLEINLSNHGSMAFSDVDRIL